MLTLANVRLELSEEMDRHIHVVHEIKAMRALGAPRSTCLDLSRAEQTRFNARKNALRRDLRHLLLDRYPSLAKYKPKPPSSPKPPTLGLLKRQFPKLRTEHFARVRALKSKLVEGRITLEEYVHKEQELKDTWEAEVRHAAG